jgi:hypothetical protein
MSAIRLPTQLVTCHVLTMQGEIPSYLTDLAYPEEDESLSSFLIELAEELFAFELPDDTKHELVGIANTIISVAENVTFCPPLKRTGRMTANDMQELVMSPRHHPVLAYPSLADPVLGPYTCSHSLPSLK